ncbi:MAG: nucleoside phosphorylase [Bacteroidales bacterium]|jgi:uridine phosphorylase|nr:nucleoside phosphorylase [Bacteroidales bacterium]MCI2121381.1 nucleoside phosphorylase [Bacteroidales bacterium]MCI2145500.1 nucleoside phosphorylase [Bacteroidales bacterium]
MNRIPESELIINTDGSIFHLHLKPENIADTIILVGDPGRVDMVAENFDSGSLEPKISSREFNTVTGSYCGKRISVISTGIGTDNIDIVMTELDALANIDFNTRMPKEGHRRLTILRLGTCGGIQPDIPLGGFVFSHVSIGFDGVLNWYKGCENVTDAAMEQAFMKYMKWSDRLATPYFVRSSRKLVDKFRDVTIKGMTVSAPGFYGPQGRSVRLQASIDDYIPKLENFRYGDYRITNIEMESSAIAGMAALMGHDAATVCCVIANRYAKESKPDYKPFISQLIKLVLEKLCED